MSGAWRGRSLALLLALAACATPAPGPESELEVEVLGGLPRVPAWEPAAPARIELVLDARAGLSQRRVGRTDAAQAVVAGARQLLDVLPPDVPVTLHALGAGGGEDCDAASAVSDPLAGSPADVAAALAEARPAARASLPDALTRLADLLARGGRASRARVVVVTDLADDCGGDLCAASQALVDAGASLELLVVGDAETPICVAAAAAPAGPPAPLASAPILSAPRFRVIPLARRPSGVTVPRSGVAGQGPVSAPAGLARIEVDLVPPLVIPEVALAPDARQRLRIVDFPSASPPVREWRLEPATGGAGAPAAASPGP